MNRPTKGSPEAYRWAEKMRKHRERIRKAGLATEKKFFSKGAPLDPSRYNPGSHWHEQAAHVAGRYRKAAETQTEKHIYAGMEMAHKDSASAARKLGMNPHSLKKSQWIVTRLKDGKVTVVGYQQAMKYYGHHGYDTHVIDPSEIETYRRIAQTPKMKKNPIAVYNPPKVSGTIYSHAIEIKAQKTSRLHGHYKHVFGPNVQILGLDNGDVLLHHKNGKRLWISREDHERTGGRHK